MKLAALILSACACLFALPNTSAAATRTAVCRVIRVVVFPERIHVQCSFKDSLGQSLNKSTTHPEFFADTVQSAKSPSIVAMATAAWQAQQAGPQSTLDKVCIGGGKSGAGFDPASTEWFLGCNDAGANTGRIVSTMNPDAGIVTVVYNDSDLTGKKFGCLNVDCRMIVQFWSGGSASSMGD